MKRRDFADAGNPLLFLLICCVANRFVDGMQVGAGVTVGKRGGTLTASIEYSAIDVSHISAGNAPQTGGYTPTEGPSWGHPMPFLGAVWPFLEPFCGHLSPKVDEIFQK